MAIFSSSQSSDSPVFSPSNYFSKIDELPHTFRAMDNARKNAFRVPHFNLQKDRYVIFSDVHKGNGQKVTDDFQHNQKTYTGALDYYVNRDFRLILNGDIEECWKFEQETITDVYGDTAYRAENRFIEQGHNFYLRTYGNHDDDWANPVNVKSSLHRVLKYPIEVHPAISLGDKILIAHGHQGDLTSDRISTFSRHFVRRFWKPIQQLLRIKLDGKLAGNYAFRGHRELCLYQWAVANQQLLIAGHTHRAVFHPHESIASDHYINIGSCVHNDGITGLEIDQGEIRLVHWASDMSRNVFKRADLGSLMARL
jgi:UDP-2,3-diacylglucosamine pyrophosphatase LpxH